MNLTHLLTERAAQTPGAPALADDTSGELTNADVVALVERYARHFSARGIGSGDVVGVKLTNRIELIAAMFATWRLGAALTPVNPALTLAETTYQLEDAGARLLVVEAVSDDLPASVPAITLAELAESAESVALPERGADRDAGLDELALLIYTSGTTGRPKGVELTHANLDAQTEEMIEAIGLTAADHSLLILPLFHVNGILVSILSPLRAGGRATIVGKFSPQHFLETIGRVRPTYFSGVPAIYAMLANLPAEVTPDMSSLRFVVCGAAPMPPQLIAAVEKRFGFTLIEGYGLSEATCASSVNPLDGVRKPGTVGPALPGQTIAIMAESGELITDGSPGEVVIKGPVVMRGYLNRPEDTAAAIRDGWLHTGDVGRLDEDGYLVLVDRVKDMIIRGGENIYPKEIETALHDHPAVLESAVVGRPDPVMGEVPVAYVSVRDGATATGDELTEFLRRRLAPYKIPYDVHVVPDIPKNSIGKIDKPTLRSRAAAQ